MSVCARLIQGPQDSGPVRACVLSVVEIWEDLFHVWCLCRIPSLGCTTWNSEFRIMEPVVSLDALDRADAPTSAADAWVHVFTTACGGHAIFSWVMGLLSSIHHGLDMRDRHLGGVHVHLVRAWPAALLPCCLACPLRALPCSHRADGHPPHVRRSTTAQRAPCRSSA